MASECVELDTYPGESKAKQTSTTDVSKNNALSKTLLKIGIKEADLGFVIEHGERYREKPAVLAAKLKIGKEMAEQVIEALPLKRKQKTTISQDNLKLIQTCLKEHPKIEDPEDIADICEVELAVVREYFDSLPFNESQEEAIAEKLNSGNSISDIAIILKLPENKVYDFIERTFITFNGADGQKTLGIIQERFPEVDCSKLREMILYRDLKLQDKLCCILQKLNPQEYKLLKKYFERFEESKAFFEIDLKLTVEDIFKIKERSLDTIEQLSKQLNKVETVIEEYLEQYQPHSLETEYYANLQTKLIQRIVDLGNDSITFQMYRMIVSISFESLIHDIQQKAQAPKDVLRQLVPMALYYLKCSLSIDPVAKIIADCSKLTLTTHELFHILFQRSEPVLKGYCIEHYSFSNPVPLYYPKLEYSGQLNICKELWYSLQEYNGLISFGLGRASWNPIGKSDLLDFIFGTDFVRGSPQASAFHLNSIDIQMTRNLFGDNEASGESTNWAYIDCHRISDRHVIDIICQQLDIALIHVSYLDYSKNHTSLKRDITSLPKSVKHVYLLIRDCEGDEVTVECKETQYLCKKAIFIPNLTKQGINMHSVRKILKEIGYEILHLKYPKYINDLFLEKVIEKLDKDSFKSICSEKQLIQAITMPIKKAAQSPGKISFSFLTYYPLFIEYMEHYYKSSFECDQQIVDNHNQQCILILGKLYKGKMGEVITLFNKLLKEKNSSLLLWKLSQNLSLLSKRKPTETLATQVSEQKNDSYTVEIIWREAFLSYYYATLQKKEKQFVELFASNFINQVERGEPFELVDGDNLKFFSYEIKSLLSGQEFLMKQAPIVVSIFGPQSSGKSTLLNYCFGCKFLTSAGRCTRGIYGSLSRLSRPVNRSNNFLILDTEGLNGIERGNIKDTADLNFDRTMVLFCLAVSQVVIINVRGDLGSEMQNLLQVCAHSLNKLKVRKVPVPKIFFVLNQQVDLDSNKHTNSIKILLEQLEESELLETDGVKASNLIQVSSDNLSILPSAFNSEQINGESSSLIKLSPTTIFAKKCAKLKMSIINLLGDVPEEERASSDTLSDWIEMSGTIWDTIIRYQDIVKYENIEQEKCTNLLRSITSDSLENKICCHSPRFINVTDNIIKEIHTIDTLSHYNTLVTKYMVEFDGTFIPDQDECLREFDFKCKSNQQLRRMDNVCDKARYNLSRLIYIERKVFEDMLKFHIRAVLTEIKLSESMKKFQEMLIQRVDTYLKLPLDEQKLAFDDLWNACFEQEDREDVNEERKDDFNNLYSVFLMESTNMDNKSIVNGMFNDYNFQTEVIIVHIKSDALSRFQLGPKDKTLDDFIFPLSLPIIPITNWTPYPGRENYDYLDPASLDWKKNESRSGSRFTNWIPKECYPLIEYRSGIDSFKFATAWNRMDKKTQILLLASKLQDPNTRKSIWEKLIQKICKEVQALIVPKPKVSQATVKQIVHLLSDCIKIINYEISFIEANLTIHAERIISTLAFALAFHSLWNIKKNKSLENLTKTEEKKNSLFKYFLQKIENRKMVLWGWDSKKMRESDITLSNKFAYDFMESIMRGLIISEQPTIEEEFRKRKRFLSHESIFLAANSKLTTELYTTQEEVLYEDNFVIQYICNRDSTLRKAFLEEWELLINYIYCEISRNIENKIYRKIECIRQVFSALLYKLEREYSGDINPEALDSYSNFEVVNMAEHGLEAKGCQFKAVVLYLKMYLDSTITSEQFSNFFSNPFEIDGVAVKKTETFILCDKEKNPANYLDRDLFKKLEQTNMFNAEYIFNIFEYISEFLSVLSKYKFNFTKSTFDEMIQHIKDEFEKDALGCPNQCPSCGKLCERELHPNNGKCQIKTGHQICSMGGKVWKSDASKTAILFMCEDYKDDTIVCVSGKAMRWKQYKQICENQWNWNIPKDPNYARLQEENREKMKKLWNQFGRGILNYYSARGTKIKYTPYGSLDDLALSLAPLNYFICFVIDGTSSMATEIEKARVSVGEFISRYSEYESRFSVVIYRDHCDKKLTEIFPVDKKFTLKYKDVQEFLKTVKAYGGGDYPEAALDGLATATTQCSWIDSSSVKNVIIHIFDAPPHGDFPDYKSHHSQSNKKHCCCCNQGTKCCFDWQRDVWDNMKWLNINYFGINTGVNFPKFEATMKDKLGYLCGEFQIVGKEVVNEAILQIFIDN